MGILLKSQYVIKHATAEDNLALITSPTKLYIGSYLETVFNTKISGDSFKTRGPNLVSFNPPKEQKGGVEFIPYDSLKPSIKKATTRKSPISSKTLPNSSDYSLGKFTRYFFLDNRTKVFIETSSVMTTSIDINIYSLHEITWSLSPTLGPKINKKTVTRLKKLGSIKINPYDHIKEFDEDE